MSTLRNGLVATAVLVLAASIHADNWPQFRGPTGQGHTKDTDLPLKPSDRILFVGHRSARHLQLRYLAEPGTVFWALSGSEPPSGHFFRWWWRRFGGI